MKNQYHISEELVERIKELGYSGNIVVKEGVCVVPTQDMLCRWLRDEYHIDICIDVVEHWFVTPDERYYRFRIYKDRHFMEDDEDYLYESYDIAVAAALERVLEKVKGRMRKYGLELKKAK